ncbi:MAG: DMT family transporter [Alphaproteobacteria bacterium]|nr:DMT family transporter [Alphaproteobacteria bacterium]
MRSTLPIGAVQALAAAALFGLSTPIAKVLLGAIDAWLLAGLLYLGSGLGLGSVILLRRWVNGSVREARLAGRDLPRLGVVVVLGGIVGPVLLMFGLEATSSSVAALLLNLEGAFTLLIAWIVLRESVDRRIGIGAAAILLGALVVGWSPGASISADVGAILIAGACLCWAVDNCVTRGISASDPLQIACVKGCAAGLVNSAIALTHGAALPPVAPAVAALGVGFAGYGASLVLFVLALRNVGAARTGAYFATAPFIGAIGSVAMLADPVTLQLVAAAALMAVGLWLHLTEQHDHEHEHQAIEHAHAHAHDLHHQHSHGPDDPRGEPHAHRHSHARHVHSHPHFPDLHHRHEH